MFEMKYVGDNYEIQVSVLGILVTIIYFYIGVGHQHLVPTKFGPQDRQIVTNFRSPTSPSPSVDKTRALKMFGTI